MMCRSVRTVSLLPALALALLTGPSLASSVMHAQAAQSSGAPAAPAPQSGAPSQTPTFRARVDSVSVDVIVTDKQGNPVTDLKADDFEIRESNKLQTVDTFRLVQTDDGLDDPAAARQILSMSDQIRETARPENRLFVVFLDDYHVRLGNSLQMRERLGRWAQTLSSHDIVAVTYPLMPIGGITFTRNHDETAAMLRSFEGRKYDYTPRNAMEERYRQQPPEMLEKMRNDLTINALESLCIYMGGLREGRKTLLYVSEGMSNTLPAGASTQGPVSRPRAPGIPQDPNAFQQSQQFFDSASLLVDLQRVFQAAGRSNTAIYTIDPRGLAPSEFGINDNVSATQDRTMLNDTTDVLRVLAGETDGRAIVNRNDPIPELKKMVRDNTTYYLLGYTSTLAPRDGRFHEIKVSVKRKDVEVRSRKGYWAYSADAVERASATPKAGPTADVATALEALSATADPGRGRSVTTWTGVERGAAEKPALTFAWETPATPAADPMDVVDHVTLVATSAGGDTLFTGLVTRDAAAGRPSGQVTFAATPGPVRLRIVTENARGLRIDTEESTVEVPDFTGTGPQLTAPFVYRGRTVRDMQTIRAATAPLPTATRAFSRTERMLLRFQAYGPAGTSPNVTMKLLNSSGTSIATLPAPTKTTGATLESEIGLSSFPPGDYLVEITAESNGEQVRRLLGIRVTG